MKKLPVTLSLSAALMLPLFAGPGAPVGPVSTATQAVTMTIASTSNITTSGNPATMAVSLNSGGSGSATDNSTTYTVTSNTGAPGSLKVTGSINSNMAPNTSLTATLSSAAGSSQGAQTLSTTAVDLVTKIPTLVSDTGAITYVFGVSNGWTIASQTISRTVTLTLTAS